MSETNQLIFGLAIALMCSIGLVLYFADLADKRLDEIIKMRNDAPVKDGEHGN